jgi:hypothetical protein
MNTTKRYVHPSDADVLEAMEKVRDGHNSGHKPENVNSLVEMKSAAIN